MIRPTLRPIITCKASELIRFTDQDGTHWALVGQRSHELLMLLVFEAGGSPYCVNIMRPMDILPPPFEKTPVLSYGSYGTGYSIRIDHAGDCEVGGAGGLINVPGAYVMTAQDDEYVCCRDTRMRDQAGYYDVKTGHVRGEPGSERAVFARWELVLNDEPSIRLLQVQANRQQVNA
jgi:hypothetical protein